ncbi:AI-2E family transporter [Psychromarinibacter sp. C21-152]|uniref:AI-2E family transporter n=1 Tax=Psychromarinibacter sediminicola TaxID=3033385 RepID=A0AAE3NR64_9RHOB|nr:AI-2E family transporter [Psychromarinibacter sediminicola]MDF0600164.1 AI-2E family transporter [Psychromarinibacter sediminicola]
MALPAKTQLRIWGVAFAAFIVIMWLLGDVILPFVLGGAVAYMLDPTADWLERRGFSRAMATVVISLGAVLIFAIVALAVVPTLVRQADALFRTFPELFRNLQGWLTTQFPALMDQDSTLRQTLVSIGEMLQAKGAALLEGVLTSAAGLLNILLLFVIVPVVAFYLLLDWDRLVARIDELLPRDHAPTIRKLAHDIDRTLASFIRGQGLVMLILGTYYGVALMLAQLQFGLVVGAIAGLLTFIPYVGAIVGGGLALGLAFFQFWGEWWMIAVVAAIFFSGQFIEGNILTPKLVGSSVGLHPVWLLFALSVFGSLFGFVGMLVAVPVAAALGVLARFGIEQYKEGRLYQGLEAPPDRRVDHRDQD